MQLYLNEVMFFPVWKAFLTKVFLVGGKQIKCTLRQNQSDKMEHVAFGAHKKNNFTFVFDHILLFA